MHKITFDPDHLTSFEGEWGLHKNCKEWWYATGVMTDADNNLYSWQYTLLYLNFGIITPKVAMIALKDFKNSRHYYLQAPSGFRNPVRVTQNSASMGEIASAVKNQDGMTITLRHKDFTLDLKTEYGKGAFWHCDEGKLQMGIPGDQERTLYYSYPNMPTKGTLILNGKAIELKGKTWFDKQGGTYSIINPKTHWEWFSLRFFDDEEMMLFTFPQDGYYDGTYISKDGKRERLNNYRIESTGVLEFAGLKWSESWKLQVDKKERNYTIEPIQQGHMNFAYFEELCYIRNSAGEIAGYCIAELLPGVRNEKMGGSISGFFRRAEF